MIEHHIQKTIIYSLAHNEELRFSDLQPDGLENKLFDYHLKALIRDGLVEKSDTAYRLTSEGRRIWKRASQQHDWFVESAHAVLFLVIRDEAGRWLLAKRKTHPLIDRHGFLHATPRPDQPVIDTASATVAKMTGLDCVFKHLGGGYLRIYDGENLESFTHFDLLVCEDAVGDLVTTEDESAEYYWAGSPDFSDPSMVPNMTLLTNMYLQGSPLFVDEEIHL